MKLFQKNTILALGVVLLLAACSKEEAPKYKCRLNL
ncbi:hypothetical protein X908_07135 [Campylobacter jejuni subsp. jejuni 81-176-DRH212]|nr:hypothetical protein X908_07135 [Campylobacter jejuni subsp. jejuni 81-176-DRH212]